MAGAGESTGCWFDGPTPGDRRSWATPLGHGTYQGLDLELLDPSDEDELTFLIEAQHTEFADALGSDEEMIVGGEPFSPRLHVAMHQVVASQLLADNPPETWQTVQRLAGLGYDWHNIMHMIAAVVSDDLYHALQEHRQFDPGDYTRRLNQLPADWPRRRHPGRTDGSSERSFERAQAASRDQAADHNGGDAGFVSEGADTCG